VPRVTRPNIDPEVTVAAQPSDRPENDEPSAEAEEPSSATAEADEVDEVEADRALWDEVRITPVEIALPAGVGITLRAYRMSDTLTPTEVDASDEDDLFDARSRSSADDEDDEDEEIVILDEEYQALVAESADDDGKDGKTDRTAEAGDEPEPADFADEEKPPAEEVPAFLSHRGKLLIFKSPESLVSFVRSGAQHDLTQLDTWADFAEKVDASDVVVAEDDSYELDLVVENLRGGHDTWDFPLLIGAGELARDLGHALRIKPVVLALSAGSPLDDLDEALRKAEGGGVGGFLGRRRLRKIGAQQASLGWRTIIGKISASVDWRD
jgi:hypothetical protein